LIFCMPNYVENSACISLSSSSSVWHSIAVYDATNLVFHWSTGCMLVNSMNDEAIEWFNILF